MNHSLLVVISASAVVYGTPLLYAALGELLAERAGVLNLGVEGMMLMGAVMGFWAVQRIDTAAPLALILAVLVAALAGALTSLDPRGAGDRLPREPDRLGPRADDLRRARRGSRRTSATTSASATRRRATRSRTLDVFGLASTPIVGPILFHQNALVYVSWVCVRGRRPVPRAHAARAQRACRRPLAGLGRRDGHQRRRATATRTRSRAARSRGWEARRFSLAITPQWVDGLTQGAGWIAIALVIFAFWRAELCLVGAYLFGAFSSLRLHAAGARRHDRARVPERAALRDDDRGARRGLVARGEAPARGAGGARHPVRARGALAKGRGDHPTTAPASRSSSAPSSSRPQGSIHTIGARDSDLAQAFDNRVD